MYSLLCNFLHHEIDRKRVWHDSLEFRANCTRCGVPMIRGHDGWRVFDTRKDSDPSRKAHPRSEQADG